MTLQKWYKDNFEASLNGRYIGLDHVQKLLDSYPDIFEINTAGTSENGIEIPLVTFGNGATKVLVWSQMHGNESTTTKALFDFFTLVAGPSPFQKEVHLFLNTYRFTVVPILNPDGASVYTRENRNAIDLNRDAKDLSQKESRVLRRLFDTIAPDLCLNMHDQRSVFGLAGHFPATLSFLAPAANKKRTITPARKEAIRYIDSAIKALEGLLPNNIGRFDDSYNPNCVGDAFTSEGVPTILFEAGHAPDDYEREMSRSYVFYALVGMFVITPDSEAVKSKDYFSISENEHIFNDVVLNKVAISKENPEGQVCLQYTEVLLGGVVTFELVVASIYTVTTKIGHKTFDLQGGSILINSQEKIHIDQKAASIFDQRNNLMII